MAGKLKRIVMEKDEPAPAAPETRAPSEPEAPSEVPTLGTPIPGLAEPEEKAARGALDLDAPLPEPEAAAPVIEAEEPVRESEVGAPTEPAPVVGSEEPPPEPEGAAQEVEAEAVQTEEPPPPEQQVSPRDDSERPAIDLDEPIPETPLHEAEPDKQTGSSDEVEPPSEEPPSTEAPEAEEPPGPLSR